MYIPTFSKRLLHQLGPIRKVLDWPRRGLPYRTESFADFVRSAPPASTSEMLEPRFEPLPGIEYPTLPDPYELPAPKAWFENFHARPTQGPSWIPETQPLTASMDGAGLNPVDQPAIEQPDLYPPEGTQPEDHSGMLEVRWAVERVQTGEVSPACLPDVSQPQDAPNGIEGQIEFAHAYQPAGLESMLTQPPDVMPEPFAPLPPGPCF